MASAMPKQQPTSTALAAEVELRGEVDVPRGGHGTPWPPCSFAREVIVTDQHDRPFGLNRIAIQEFKKLIEADASLSERCKNAVLGLIQDGSPPSSLTELETMMKGGEDVGSQRIEG